jgi:hypothetical protein
MWDRESQNPTGHFSDSGVARHASRLHDQAAKAVTIHAQEFSREKHSPCVMITQPLVPSRLASFADLVRTRLQFTFMPYLSGMKRAGDVSATLNQPGSGQMRA